MAWVPEYMCMLGTVAVMAIFLLVVIPRRVVAFVGSLPGMSANWVSIERAPITLLGVFMIVVADGDPLWIRIGFATTGFGFLLDRYDGRIVKCILKSLKRLKTLSPISNGGRTETPVFRGVKSPPMTPEGKLWVWLETEALDEEGEKYLTYAPIQYEDWVQRLTQHHTRIPMFRVTPSDLTDYPGLIMRLTGMGEWIDPLMDKACFIPILSHLLWGDYIWPPVTVAMIISDLVSTVFRKPFDVVPGFRYLHRWVVEEAASPFGKTKVVWQLLTLLVLTPALAGWLNNEQLETSPLPPV